MVFTSALIPPRFQKMGGKGICKLKDYFSLNKYLRKEYFITIMLNYNRFTNPFHRQIVKKQVKSILFQRIKTITLPKNSHMSLEMAYNLPPPDSHFITPCERPACQTQKALIPSG